MTHGGSIPGRIQHHLAVGLRGILCPNNAQLWADDTSFILQVLTSLWMRFIHPLRWLHPISRCVGTCM